MRIRLAIVAAILLASPAASAQQPQFVSKGQAQGLFAESVVACLRALETNSSIANTPAVGALALRPATAAERTLTTSKDPSAPVWTTEMLGEHLTVTEASPDKCLVVADQLPVEATFAHAALSLLAKQPDLTTVDIKPGYWPIVRQWQRTEDGARYAILLQGAEPGAPGHEFRFSLLIATVTRAPLPGASAQEDMGGKLVEAHGDRRAQIIEALNQHSDARLYVSPHIPANVSQNALARAAAIGVNEELLAVSDSTVARNGTIGVYFFEDGIVDVPPASRASFIPYSYIRANSLADGAFIVRAGNARIEANLIGKAEMTAILAAAAEAAK